MHMQSSCICICRAHAYAYAEFMHMKLHESYCMCLLKCHLILVLGDFNTLVSIFWDHHDDHVASSIKYFNFLKPK